MNRFLILVTIAASLPAGVQAQVAPPAVGSRASEPPPRRFLDRFRRRDEPVPPPAPAATPAPLGGSRVASGSPVATPGPPAPPTGDPAVRRSQARVGDMMAPIGSGPIPPMPAPSLSPVAPAEAGSQSLSLQAALYGALTSNPDLVSLRAGNVQGNAASPEAVEVARRFPTTLNPTLWIDYRPINLIPNGTFGGGASQGGASGAQAGGNGRGNQPYYSWGQNFIYISLRQPVELGHQTRYRYAIAREALNQQRWTVLQAELLTLVQTYRFFQTAAYRREKLKVAEDLANFNDRLVATLRRRLEANQVTADAVALAEVEAEATRQQVEVARQDYATALTDLRNQIGAPEGAGTAEPLGAFILPRFRGSVDDEALVQLALENRPEIHAAAAQVRGARAAIGLAKGDRIPTPIIGPEYEQDEAGVQYVGLVYITPVPIWNSGKALVRQREAEYERANIALDQIQKRTVTQVRAATAKWNQANQLVDRTDGLTDRLRGSVETLERLFEAGQTDLSKLLQARQRLIQLENARLDAIWQATQAQADLLTALGAPTLINALERSVVADDTAPSPKPPMTAPSPPPTPVGSAPAPR